MHKQKCHYLFHYLYHCLTTERRSSQAKSNYVGRCTCHFWNLLVYFAYHVTDAFNSSTDKWNAATPSHPRKIQEPIYYGISATHTLWIWYVSDNQSILKINPIFVWKKRPLNELFANVIGIDVHSFVSFRKNILSDIFSHLFLVNRPAAYMSHYEIKRPLFYLFTTFI